jgi:hypothetical protein
MVGNDRVRTVVGLGTSVLRTPEYLRLMQILTVGALRNNRRPMIKI